MRTGGREKQDGMESHLSFLYFIRHGPCVLPVREGSTKMCSQDRDPPQAHTGPAKNSKNVRLEKKMVLLAFAKAKKMLCLVPYVWRGEPN